MVVVEDLADELVDRRAELIAVPQTARSSQQDKELNHLTAQLAAILDDPRPAVRRLIPESRDEPGAVARRLAEMEPVHPVRDEADLRDRLDTDRRCFLLEHPRLPGRPLNVVWCALTVGTPGRIEDVLDAAAPTVEPTTADTAVFYSIWNAEPGLSGLPGGRSLIEGAAAELRDELPHLKTFVTLSPVPGLRRWLDREGLQGDPSPGQLRRWTVRYLTSLDEQGRPVDPVARFHLGNGARLVAVRLGADSSSRAHQQSFGTMANYRYEPEDRAANRAQLAEGTVAVADTIVA